MAWIMLNKIPLVRFSDRPIELFIYGPDDVSPARFDLYGELRVVGLDDFIAYCLRPNTPYFQALTFLQFYTWWDVRQFRPGIDEEPVVTSESVTPQPVAPGSQPPDRLRGVGGGVNQGAVVQDRDLSETDQVAIDIAQWRARLENLARAQRVQEPGPVPEEKVFKILDKGTVPPQFLEHVGETVFVAVRRTKPALVYVARGAKSIKWVAMATIVTRLPLRSYSDIDPNFDFVQGCVNSGLWPEAELFDSLLRSMLQNAIMSWDYSDEQLAFTVVDFTRWRPPFDWRVMLDELAAQLGVPFSLRVSRIKELVERRGRTPTEEQEEEQDPDFAPRHGQEEVDAEEAARRKAEHEALVQRTLNIRHTAEARARHLAAVQLVWRTGDTEKARILMVPEWWRVELWLNLHPKLAVAGVTPVPQVCLSSTVEVQGQAGTGKTLTTNAVVATRAFHAEHDPANEDFFSSVLSASSAKGAQALGNGAKTVHSLARLKIDSNKVGFLAEDDTHREIIRRGGMFVVDEISLLGGETLSRLRGTVQGVRGEEVGLPKTAQVMAPGFGAAKAFIVGDPNQLGAVGKGPEGPRQVQKCDKPASVSGLLVGNRREKNAYVRRMWEKLRLYEGFLNKDPELYEFLSERLQKFPDPPPRGTMSDSQYASAMKEADAAGRGGHIAEIGRRLARDATARFCAPCIPCWMRRRMRRSLRGWRMAFLWTRSSSLLSSRRRSTTIRCCVSAKSELSVFTCSTVTWLTMTRLASSCASTWRTTVTSTRGFLSFCTFGRDGSSSCGRTSMFLAA
jgi:hypothetical protein